MPGLNMGSFYDRYATQNQLANQTAAKMGGNKTTERSGFQQDEPPDTKKTLGGALLAGAGGAGSGAMVVSAVPGIGTAWGAAGGFALGFAGYMLS